MINTTAQCHCHDYMKIKMNIFLTWEILQICWYLILKKSSRLEHSTNLHKVASFSIKAARLVLAVISTTYESNTMSWGRDSYIWGHRGPQQCVPRTSLGRRHDTGWRALSTAGQNTAADLQKCTKQKHTSSNYMPTEWRSHVQMMTLLPDKLTLHLCDNRCRCGVVVTHRTRPM